MKTGIELIKAERRRVQRSEKFDADHDSEHAAGELLGAAGCYIAQVLQNIANGTGCMEYEQNTRMQVRTSEGKWIDAWPFEKEWDKRKKHDDIKLLIHAGQFIASEIDRLQNQNNL